MKSAKEMFEELGYEYSKTNDELDIDYWKDEPDGWKHICFHSHQYRAEESYEWMDVDMPTFKAIQKQLEELEWI